MDSISSERRSANMRAIRRRDTAPEMLVRRLVRQLGYRPVVDYAKVPGRPDIALPSRRKAIFVHGCFWHGHDSQRCRIARLPKSRRGYWWPKIAKNRQRDKAAVACLRRLGWRVLVIWECGLKRPETQTRRIQRFLSECESSG